MPPRKASFYRWLNLGLILTLAALIFVLIQWPDKQFHLIVCNVGQGDGLILTYQNLQMVVDGGPDESILSCLGEHLPFWDKTIEAVVMTHPQADHLTGLIEIVKRYRVEHLFAPSLVNDVDEFWALKEAVLAKKVPVSELIRGEKLFLGPVKLTVLWPQESGGNPLAWQSVADHQKLLGAQDTGDPNLFSAVLEGEFGQNQFLLTGDLDDKSEKQLTNLGIDEIEVLKVAHHGSRYSSGQKFLEAVKPKLALISVGKNRFGHPTAEALNRLAKVGAKVLRTDQLGTIELTSNGVSWWQN